VHALLYEGTTREIERRALLLASTIDVEGNDDR